MDYNSRRRLNLEFAPAQPARATEDLKCFTELSDMDEEHSYLRGLIISNVITILLEQHLPI